MTAPCPHRVRGLPERRLEIEALALRLIVTTMLGEPAFRVEPHQLIADAIAAQVGRIDLVRLFDALGSGAKGQLARVALARALP